MCSSVSRKPVRCRSQRLGYLPASNDVSWRSSALTYELGPDSTDLTGGWYTGEPQRLHLSRAEGSMLLACVRESQRPSYLIASTSPGAGTLVRSKFLVCLKPLHPFRVSRCSKICRLHGAEPSSSLLAVSARRTAVSAVQAHATCSVLRWSLSGHDALLAMSAAARIIGSARL